jgi:hypothetical protein
MQSRTTALLTVFLFLLTGTLLAQWAPPADNKLTERQLKIYLNTQNDWLATIAKLDAAKPMPGDVAKAYQKCLDNHLISRQEFEWIGQRAADAWSAIAYLDATYKSAKDRIAEESTQNDAALDAAQKQLAEYQQAQSNGWRILTPDDRAAAIKTAQDDQASALNEVKRYGDAAIAAEADAAQHDADAKAAEDQSANPPPDVSADDRAEYIQNKKNEAQAARSSATDARNDEADDKKNQADAQSQVDAAVQRAAHPEIPFTDDEKNQAKADNDAGILAAKNAIAAASQETKRIATEQADLEKTAKATTKNVPPENLTLLRKYQDQYKEQFAQAAGTTRPTQ